MNSSIFDIIKTQREFFATRKTEDLSFRRHLLQNLRLMLEENEGKIISALNADLGKSPRESYMTEIGMVHREINLALRNLAVWSSPKPAVTPLYLFPAKSKRYTHPLGVTMIFSPWNYPVNLSLIPLVSSIAAGNCTILKLSEHSKHTTALLCDLIDRYFDREYIAAFTDSFEALKAIRTEHIDLVFYTGGSTVAKLISKAAADQLTPVVLELGGKSPCIVDESADLKTAAKRIVTGKLFASGQTCVAPDYLFVHSSVKTELTERIKEYIEKLFPNGMLKSDKYPKIINKMHFERLKNYLSDGRIISGGGFDDHQNKIELTLMENINHASKLHFEEIFGPILPVYEFSDIDVVINFISKKEKPLAMYIFSHSRKNIRKTLDHLSFGCGCVNDTVMQMANPYLPFGGVGESGMGCYHGRAGFDTFSSKSSVLLTPDFDVNKFRYNPFSDRYGFIRFILRRLP